MLVTVEQMKAIERAAFGRGIRSRDLMERAGLAIAREVTRFFPVPGRLLAICGKGNNAGDVLVAARYLRRAGWLGEELLIFPEDSLSPQAADRLSEFRSVAPPAERPLASPKFVVLDGLLGIGAVGEPREPVAGAIRHIESLRRAQGAFVVAADIPSGLDADTGRPAACCVTADLTVTIGLPKAGLVADAAANHTGRLAFAPLEELDPAGGDSPALITQESLRPLLRPPAFDSHKGIWGRVGIAAGSRGMLGAARLCSAAALHAGGGLVTLYALPETYELLAATCPPEIMVKPVSGFAEMLQDKLDAAGIGPGLGEGSDAEILSLFSRLSCPAVFDADALNAISRKKDGWPAARGPRLLTPHPGEMARLFPPAAALGRQTAAEAFTDAHPDTTLLLKGSRTIIAQKGRPSLFNTTGNPGMGSGGMGDVLTGVSAALLARRFPPRDAAMLAAWVCGRAAEIAVFQGEASPDSLVASDVLSRLGEAFLELSRGSFSAVPSIPFS